jgi:predicted esterase
MIPTRLPLFLIFFPVTLACGDEVLEMQNWTRDKDKKSISASLHSFDLDRDKVTLKLKEGKVVDIKVSDLVPDHISRLKDLDKEIKIKEEAASKPRLTSQILEDGGAYKIHVYKPAGYIDDSPSSRNRPIAFLYSPGGDSMSMVERLKLVSDELGWVIVGVDAYANTESLEDKYEERMKNTKAAFEWAKNHISFDSKKIVFGGMSGGAWWSYQSASDLTKEAAGILAFGGWMGNMYDKKYSKKMAVAMVNGDMDKNAIHYEEKDGDFLKKRASCEVNTFHFPGGHVLAPSDVALEAARWIHQTMEFGEP